MLFRGFHGTTSMFSVLSPSQYGLFGAGVYLTNDFADAAMYGPYVATVTAEIKRPFCTEAEYETASELFDLDSPAGKLLVSLFSGKELDKIVNKARSSLDYGIEAEISRRLQSLGHDGILARWSNGILHAIVFSGEQVCIDRWDCVGDFACHDR